MAFFEWSEDYSVKNDKMDEQHKNLIKMVNQFYELVENQDEQKQVLQCFNKIVDYTSYHFQEEEKLMLESDFPGARHHINIHKQLVERVLNLKKELESGSLEARNQTKFFLKNWLTSHIKGIDKKYSTYLH